MEGFLYDLNALVWGLPALVLILGVGLFLTLRGKCFQLRLLPRAMGFLGRSIRRKEDQGARRALCTALAATVGTGNIAGVAGAIALGGPGVVFWMWVSAFLGMATKYAEAMLSVSYRVKDGKGGCLGGPMYYIRHGLGSKSLAAAYALFGVIAAFGVGNATQINAVTECVSSLLPDSKEMNYIPCILGILMALGTLICLLGGGKRVGRMCESLVPLAAGGYVLLCLLVLLPRPAAVLRGLSLILQGAFSPRSVTGGALGSAFLALRVGISRGVFTNEAGMGTAGIAHGSSDTRDPASQGMMGILEVFLDTVVICTMTALVILSSDISIPYGTDPGVALTAAAFRSALGPWVQGALTVFLVIFAFATMIGWGYYGISCARYLLGKGSAQLFVWFQALAAGVSMFLNTGTVWLLSETVNGLMAIPNLLALFILTPRVLGKEKPRRRIGAAAYGIRSQRGTEITASPDS